MTLTLRVYSPQPGQLETYREALERLNASIAFKSSEEDTTQAVSFEFFASLARVYSCVIRLVSSRLEPPR